MTGQVHSHGWALGSQAQPIRMSFPHKMALLQTEIPPSDDPAGEEAGYGGPGLAWLHVV
jgi:hypothetical protein